MIRHANPLRCVGLPAITVPLAPDAGLVQVSVLPLARCGLSSRRFVASLSAAISAALSGVALLLRNGLICARAGCAKRVAKSNGSKTRWLITAFSYAGVPLGPATTYTS